MQPERLQKILSQWGCASRRRAEELILDGRVRLNGEVAHLGQKADPDCDLIELDGQRIQPTDRPQSVYLLLNKPLGVVSTCLDPQHRRTVMDLLPNYLNQQQGVHPVGRLDADSTGALLLTNHGDLTYYLTHPRHHIPKAYEVWVEGFPPDEILLRWRQGIIVDSHKTMPAKVKVLKRGTAKTLLEVVLVEGRNRQIRRVAEILGHPVIRLHRVAIGTIRLQPLGQPTLPSGSFRPLTSAEVDYLKSRIGLTSVRSAAETKEKSQ
jgi:23S rRNA pseudouridine2605 synthase